MSGEKETPHETLDVRASSAFPSVLLLKKRPADLDAAAQRDKLVKLQQNGSAVLQQIKSFLPQMQESEAALRQKMLSLDDPEQLDIEHVEEGSAAVEFNLALFEQPSSDSDDNSSSDSSDSDSDSDACLTVGRPKKKSGKAPKISVCDDDDKATHS